MTVSLCGFLCCLGLGQKIDSNITLLPLLLSLHGTHPKKTCKHTNEKPCHSHSVGISDACVLNGFNIFISLGVTLIWSATHSSIIRALISFSLPVLSLLHARPISTCSLTRLCLFLFLSESGGGWRRGTRRG